MPNYYTYLISSLPMLQFGAKPPFSFSRFLEMCPTFILEEDLNLLKNLPQVEAYATAEVKYEVIHKYFDFERQLRNELVKIRGQHMRMDAQKYIRGEAGYGLYLNHIAISAHRAASLLEGEKILDQARWQAWEELGTGHYFDTEILLIYAYKLLILERWERINNADKEHLIDEALT